MVRAECRHELLARPRELGIGFGPALRGLQVLREADAEQALLGALGRQRARNPLDDVDTIGDPENILLVVKEGRAVGNRGGFPVG